MKSTCCAVICASLFLAAAPVVAQTGNDLFQQALVKERADGDLQGAIQIYERIAREFTVDRTLAAKALVQLGQCYEKLGSTEAERAYRRVVREFADQDDLVLRAQSRLAALQRAARASEVVNITTRKVWSGPEAEADDPTPDGKYLVYRDLMGTQNLALREISTGQTRYLTQDAGPNALTNAYSARVSPDGKWVAHGFGVYEHGGSLRIVGLDGKNLRVLLEQPGCWIQPHDWTSDGEQIAARWDCWPGPDSKEGMQQIVLVSVTDGTKRVVHEVPGTGHALRSWLSPDDRYLVYGGPAQGDDDNADIWLLPLDGGEVRPLVQHPADDRILGWVPGSDFVVFLSDRDGTWDLWAIAVCDGKIDGPPRKIWRDMGEVDPAGFSANGSLLYSVFTRWFNTSIAPFDVGTGMADLDAATPLLGSNRGAEWSPDGRYLAFETESELTEGKCGRINIRDLTTGEQRELATYLCTRQFPEWSPDGGSLLVHAYDGRREPQFWKVDVPSEETTPLVAVPNANEWLGGWTMADWSHDGEAIIYSVMKDSAGQSRLVRRDLSSGKEQVLHRDSMVIRRPFELSPDGRQVAFVFMDSLNATGPGGLAILDLDTGARRRIVMFGDSATGWEVSLHWTPDGKKIVYSQIVRDDEWRTNVYRVAASGGDPKYLWTFGEGKWGGWFELSPDARQIALTTYTQENEIWVMDNLKETLERER
jgi:Tol biopolymer transport system component